MFGAMLQTRSIFPAVVSVSGTIEKIEPLGGGQFELSVRSGKSLSTFVVSGSTMVQAFLPAKRVKPGHKILLSPIGAKEGVKGVKRLFGNMSAGTKKFLGLPDVPEIPEVPKIPQIPKLPDYLKKGKRTEALEKGGQMLPGTEGQPLNLKASALETAQVPGAGDVEMQKQKEEEEPPEPKDAGFGTLTPSPISPATSEEPLLVRSGKRVVQSKKTRAGIEISLEDEAGSESVVLPPDAQVIQVLSIKDLRKRMNVSLEVADDPDQKWVQRIIVT